MNVATRLLETDDDHGEALSPFQVSHSRRVNSTVQFLTHLIDSVRTDEHHCGAVLWLHVVGKN